MNVNNPAMQRIRKLQSDLAAAQARIAELEAAQQWQPIETAPKGDYLYVWQHGWQFGGIGRWHPLRHCWIEAGGYIEPTHWMPLPAPPALTGEPR